MFIFNYIMTDNSNTYTLDESLDDLFFDITGITFDDKLFNLSKCDCCLRHKINKPYTYSRWVDTPLSFNDNNTCSCNCRHLARFICRQYPYSYCYISKKQLSDDILR